MDKFTVAMLATAPIQAFLVWAACWLTLDTLRERRKARTAATTALASAGERLRNKRPDPLTQPACHPRARKARTTPRIGMPNPPVTTLARPIVAPYITAWSSEQDPPHQLIAVPNVGIAYADETAADRDRNGVLWYRTSSSPGQGRPDFARVHPQRQRRAMLRLLCQVCAGPADETDDGVLWLLQDYRDRPDWPNRMAVTEPPVCLPCVRTSLQRCPALRTGAVTFRARRYPTAGVRGALHTGRNLAFEGDVTTALDDPKIRWVRAINLLRELNDCTIIPLDEIAN